MDAEIEAFLRSWRSMPNGGHDPEFVRTLWKETAVDQQDVSNMLRGNQSGNGQDDSKGGNK